MSISTNIIYSKSIKYAANPAIMAIYECPGVGAGASGGDVLALELLGSGIDPRHVPDFSLDGESFAIKPLMIGASCSSTDLDIEFHTVDTTSASLAIYNPYTLEAVNLVKYEQNLGNLILINQMDPMESYIYAMLVNNDGSNATGTVHINLTYMTILSTDD